MYFWKKKKKKKILSVKICPKCMNSTLYRAVSGSWTLTEFYKCRTENCDYEGAFYLEVDPNEKGENFVNLEKLKKIFPEDVEKETEIDLTEETLKNASESKNSNSD